MDTTHGFQLAVADDAANQLLTSLWSAKGLDGSFDLANGSFGVLPILFRVSRGEKGLVKSMEELRANLNPANWVEFEAVAPKGIGVFDTLKSVGKLVIKSLS